jgi:hypothetical protein
MDTFGNFIYPLFATLPIANSSAVKENNRNVIAAGKMRSFYCLNFRGTECPPFFRKMIKLNRKMTFFGECKTSIIAKLPLISVSSRIKDFRNY